MKNNDVNSGSVSGYIVFSGVRRSHGVQGLRVIVQSDRSPEYVESRIEEFLLQMRVSNFCPVQCVRDWEGDWEREGGIM